jgi:hypothetical protein
VSIVTYQHPFLDRGATRWALLRLGTGLARVCDGSALIANPDGGSSLGAIAGSRSLVKGREEEALPDCMVSETTVGRKTLSKVLIE